MNLYFQIHQKTYLNQCKLKQNATNQSTHKINVNLNKVKNYGKVIFNLKNNKSYIECIYFKL